MSAAEKKEKAKTIRARYDGKCFVPEEPVDLEPGTAVEVRQLGAGPTWAEMKLGAPRLVPKGEGPSSDQIINEQRGSTEGPTFLERRLGIKLHPRENAPLLSDIISEQRGTV